MKIRFELLLVIGLGVVCQLAGLPFPAPLVLVEAAFLLTVLAGYQVVNRLAAVRNTSQRSNYSGPDDGQTLATRIASGRQVG